MKWMVLAYSWFLQISAKSIPRKPLVIQNQIKFIISKLSTEGYDEMDVYHSHRISFLYQKLNDCESTYQKVRLKGICD